MPYAERIIAADPLEQIAVELVEALVELREELLGLEDGDTRVPIFKIIDAALQKAGAR